jgi:hypothetical protein
VALGSPQPITEMSTRNFPGVKKRPARRADNLAECLKIWEPQPLAALRASTACTGINLPLLYRFRINSRSSVRFRDLVRFLGRRIGPLQGLYLCRTTRTHKQNFLGRTNRLLSFETTRTALKTKQIRGDTGTQIAK